MSSGRKPVSKEGRPDRPLTLAQSPEDERSAGRGESPLQMAQGQKQQDALWRRLRTLG